MNITNNHDLRSNVEIEETIKSLKVASCDTTRHQMKYINARGIFYPNELKSIKKSSNQLQPVFEAFINAWDAIWEKYTSTHLTNGDIEISFYYSLDLFEKEQGRKTLRKITVSDNGIGLNDKGYKD